LLIVLLMTPESARAGGGPENVAVVINADSWASLAVANEYVALRRIPECNVIYLSELPGNLSIDVQQFRELILKPVLQTLDKRGLTGQIDCIAYSADLPYSVQVQGDLGEHRLHGVSTPDASINGLTYLYPLVLTKDSPGYLSLTANRYFRHVAGAPEHRARATDSRQRADQAKKSEAATLETQPPRAFHGETGWSSAGEPASPSEGRRYLLSTMLAMTSGRGNSVREAIDGLRRSAVADGVRPKGTIYYLENGDIRSTTRQWGFLSAARRLKQLGVAAEVLQGVLPQKKADVAGAMIGAADFNWKTSGSTILPGAICEHLTSFGGSMQESGGQTPISELLRYGAAGSSGTVTEPYAIQNKFPTPFLHVYYASGCTLAEAFYQSVRGPYQLLIIGDPLCRPWAAIPQVRIEGPLGAAITGPTILRAVTGQGVKAGRSELYLDGRRVSRLPCGGEIRIDGGSLSDGYHEIRASIAAADPIETQGNAIVPIVVDNHGRSIQVDLPPKSVRLDQWVRLRARMPQARRILWLHNWRELAAADGPEAATSVPAAKLGLGKVRLQPVALLGAAKSLPLSGLPLPETHGSAGGQTTGSPIPAAELCLGRPVELEIVPATPLPAIKQPPAGLAPGLRLSTPGQSMVVVEQTRQSDWLAKVIRPGQEFTLEGYFETPAEDMYQFQTRASIGVELAVDGQVLSQAGRSLCYFPVSLAAGLHRLTVKGRTADHCVLELYFGGPGATSIGADRFRCDRSGRT
jgi:uncharacterized protein (TIGR03790 family)